MIAEPGKALALVMCSSAFREFYFIHTWKFFFVFFLVHRIYCALVMCNFQVNIYVQISEQLLHNIEAYLFSLTIFNSTVGP